MTKFVQTSEGLMVPERLVEPSGGIVFCDESGNSGPNYLDKNQPFYVLAGWLVPDDRAADVAVAIDLFRQRHFRQRDELKADAILRNDRTKRLGAELFTRLGQLRCVPLYLVAEKRFCVAGKIVETFLDPAYNDVVRDPLTSDVSTKQEIANTLYEQLDGAVLDRFAEAYREPAPEQLEAALHEVYRAIDRDISEALARALLGSLPHIGKIAEAESAHWLPRNVDATLNMPCLVSFLMLVENLGRLGLVRPIRIVHDQHHGYEEAYAKIFELHKGVPRLFTQLPHTDVAYSGLEHVAVFETLDSKDSPIIQAADLLAGVIAHCCKSAVNTGATTDADLDLVDLVMPGLLLPEPRLTWLVCSEHCIRRLGSEIIKPALARIQPHALTVQHDNEIDDALAPMFPSRLSPKAKETDQPRVLMPFPIYSIVGMQSGHLMLVCNDGVTEGPMQSFAFMFSDRKRAQAFLAQWDEDELAERQQVVEFGPSNGDDLVQLLLAASEWTECAVLDPDDEGPFKLIRLRELAQGLGARLDRVRRLYLSGLDRVLTERVTIGEVEILTMQASDGRFGALIPPDGKIYFGASRSEAVERLRECEGLILPDTPDRSPDA